MQESTDQETETQWLKREAAIGFAQLESGQTLVVESMEHFKELIRGEKQSQFPEPNLTPSAGSGG